MWPPSLSAYRCWLLAVSHPVLLPALPRADHVQRAILGQESIILSAAAAASRSVISAAVQGRKVIILPLSGGVSKD